jgi:rod shape determining protein RodA
MPRIDRRTLASFDWSLFGLVLVLLGMGLGNLFSATHAGVAAGEDVAAEFSRQLVALGIGAAGAVLALVLDYRRFERLAFPIYFATCLLVASTLVLAPMHRGSQSWLMYGPIRLQPSEFSKIGLVLALSRTFQMHPPSELRRLRDLWRPGLVIALPVGLIVAQKDMGVALLTLLIGATYLPFVRIPWRAWAAVAAAGAAALVGLWVFVLADYQRTRVLDLFDPGRDPLASGYQVIQSRIAIGSGGMFGKGWLEGTQTQLRFLPTQHTDFIFSVLAEEWGFIGGAVALGLYLTLLLWGLLVARRARDPFGAMLAVGVVGIFFWPAMINVAMVLGLFPVIGVALPLFSYGGSAMIASVAALGLLLNVSMRRYLF